MTGLNGIEVTKRIRKLFPEVKVIVWSICADYGCAFEAVEAGASGYVVKDSGMSFLITAIKEAKSDTFYLSPPLSRQRFDEFQIRMRRRIKS